MTGTPSTPYSRDLGDELRQLRETRTRHNGSWMGELLGWDQSKVSNVENGKARASEIDVVQYLTICGQTREFIEDFLSRYRNAFDRYFVQVPEKLRTMAMAEAAADKITAYDMVIIPGLLQTEQYARELFLSGGYMTDDEIETFVQFRMDRQSILRRHDRPDMTFFVHEMALNMKVGSDALMKQQYERLLFNTHTVRIVPMSSGHRGALDAAYVLWEYEKASPVAFAESRIAKVFAQDNDAVQRCRAIFNQLDAVALDERQSRRMLAKLAGRPREGSHDFGTHVAEEQLQRPH